MRAKLMSCFVLPLLCYSAVFSQSQVSSVDLFYETDADVCLPNHQRELDSLIDALVCHPAAYLAEVTGHTDSDGSDAYNIALSRRRAQGVSAYLKQKGFRSKTTVMHAQGEFSPVASNDNELGKAQNRRVSVVLVVDQPKLPQLKGLTPEASRISVNAAKGDTLNFSTGTKVYVPANAFVDAKGNEVKGKVDIVFTEYRDLVDIAFSDINMWHGDSAEGTFLKSAGMFDLRVFKGKEELQFNENTDVQVDFRMVSTMPNLQFLSYNDSLRNWESKFFITNKSGKSVDLPKSKYRLLRTAKQKPSLKTACYWTPFEADARMYKIAMPFCESDSSMYMANKVILRAAKKFISFDCAYSDIQLDEKNEQLANLELQLKLLKGKYLLQIVKETRKTLEFKLESSGRGTNLMSPFKGYTWLVNKSDTDLKNFLTKRVSLVELTAKDGDIKMVLVDAKDTIRFSHLELNLINKQMFQESYPPNEAMGEYTILEAENRNAQRELQLKINEVKLKRDSLVDIVELKMNQNVNLNSNLMRYRSEAYPDVTCLNCVWEMNQPLMTDAEKRLSFEAWLRYADNNKPKLKARLDSLYQTTGLQAKLDTIEMLEKKYPDYNFSVGARSSIQTGENSFVVSDNVSPSTKVDIGGLIKTFFVSAPGVYNCDQIARLPQPVMVDATYRNEDGKGIVPMKIVYLDKTVGVVLTYDGYYNLGPEHFGLSQRSEFKILAFDSEGKLYLASKTDTSLELAEEGKGKLTVRLKSVNPEDLSAFKKTELLSSR